MPCYFPFIKDTMPLPCGKCPYCIQRRANDWIFKITQESYVSDSAYFVTLTYKDAPIDENGLMTLNKQDVQKFFKRLRKIPRDFSSKSIRYYLCGEYGSETYRPHYHAIIFNSSPHDIQLVWENFIDFHEDLQITLGITTSDVVNGNTIAYCTKYMTKGKLIPKWKDDKRLPEFQLFSKGLGKNYVTQSTINYHTSHPTRAFVTVNGYKKALPRYFRDRIIICPVLKLVSRLFATEMAMENLSKQYNEWIENKTYHQTFEQYRSTKKHHALEVFRKTSLENRKKFR